MEKPKFTFKDLFPVLKQTFKEWNSDNPFRLSAIVAYYAIFSLPALLIITVNVAGYFLGKEAVQGEISSQISGMIGPEAATSIQDMVANASKQGQSWIAIVIGIATLLFGATGVFYQLQLSLNQIWGVEINPETGIKKLAIDRATSLGLVVALGFLLLISLVITTILSSLSDWISTQLPQIVLPLSYVIDVAVSLAVVTMVFALIFKVLPDVKITWHDTWIGAVITAILFLIGKYAIGFYFGKSDPGSVYGVAGSVVLIMLWVNYSCLIAFFGAEFTQVFARRFGTGIRPTSKAHRIEKEPPFKPKRKGHEDEDEEEVKVSDTSSS